MLPFGLCNAPATFQRVVLGIVSDLIHDCVEVYMNDFIVYGNTFEETLENLEKVLKRCKETNPSLSHEKFFMMFMKGIVFGYHISRDGIKVDKSKVEVISKLPIPNCQQNVRSFLGFTGYYRRFIEKFRSSRIFKKEKPSIDIQDQDTYEEDSLKVNKSFEGTSHQNQNIQKEKQKESINTIPIIEQTTSTSTPRFPERLQIDRGVEKHIFLPN